MRHINLYGFWNQTSFLTKSGDLGMVLAVHGIDYESLDRKAQDYAVKRLEAALKIFGPGFHLYQYLFKSNRPDIPFAQYDDPVVEAAIEQRRQFFASKLRPAVPGRNLLCHRARRVPIKDRYSRCTFAARPRSRARDRRTHGTVQRQGRQDPAAIADRSGPGPPGTTG